MPKPQPHIKQRVLFEIRAQRELRDSLRRDLKQVEDELAKDETLTIYALDLGASVEPGALACGVEEKDGPRRPAYKELYAGVAGPDAVERAIAACVPKLVRTLAIVERAR